MQTIKIASMVILKHGSKYLLLKRARDPNIGKYLPVGGKLDPNETPMACAIRETKEETGISIENPKFCGTLIETSPVNYNWMCYIYIAKIDDMTPPDCNEGKLEWIDESQLATVPTPPTDWHIYQYVKAGRHFAFSASYDANLKMIEMVDEMEGIKLNLYK
jgi:8-oxo-dGTP diphosphatase